MQEKQKPIPTFTQQLRQFIFQTVGNDQKRTAIHHASSYTKQALMPANYYFLTGFLLKGTQADNLENAQ